MLLDPVEDVHAHPAVHHVDGQTPLAEAACAADPVQVRLVVRVAVLVDGQVKVDDHRHLLHVNTCTCREAEMKWRRQQDRINSATAIVQTKNVPV